MKKLILYALISIGILTICFLGYIAIGFYSVAGPHKPIIEDQFFFHRTGEAREYTFKPKIFKNYNVAIVSSHPFPIKEKFDWVVKYQIIENGKLIKEGFLQEKTRLYSGRDLETAKAIDFASFGILRIWPALTTLRLIVEKGDENAVKYANDFKVAVRISWYM